MSVAHHKVVDLIRSRRRTLTMTNPADYETLDLLPANQTSTEEQVEQNLERERILKAMSELPEAQREVIMLAYFEGYSQSEMAKKLNTTFGDYQDPGPAGNAEIANHIRARCQRFTPNNQDSSGRVTGRLRPGRS